MFEKVLYVELYSSFVKCTLNESVFIIFLIGKTGDWKNHFSPELNKRIDEWIASNLKGSDLTFITELEQQD